MDREAPTLPDRPEPAERVESLLTVGMVLGRYRIVEILGEGGMGVVARALDLDLGRDVALKVALATRDPASDQQRAELLLREARAMAKLRKRNVRTVYEVGTASGIDYIAMEYIAGVDLAQWLATPRSTDEIIEAFVAAGEGLAAAHAASILHRDFKPANVLVGDDGDVVVSDLGLARWFHEHGTAGGTPAYAAPDTEPDARSDQYSFCVALAEALPAEPAVLAITRRGRSANPDDRFPSMTDVVAALRSVRGRRRRRLIAIAVALAACVVGAAIAWRLHGASTPTADDLAAKLAETRALVQRGYLKSARESAESALAMATAALPELAYQAQYELGVVAIYQDDISAARAALESAASVADTRGDGLVRARALVQLFMIAVSRGSDRQVADRAEQAAVVAVARTDLDRGSRALLLFAQSIRDVHHGGDGLALLARAAEQISPPSPDVLVLWSELARARAKRARSSGRVDEAIAIYRELIANADRLVGSASMQAVGARGDLAVALEDAGREDESAVVMDELRGIGATPAGVQLLDELVGPGPPTHVISLVVRDASGQPVAGATVVSATDLTSNGTSLRSADSLYAARESAMAVATTDATGAATLSVADHAWLAAEHPMSGRSPFVVATDRAVLSLSPWATLEGTAASGDRIIVASATNAGTPRLETRARDRHFHIARIPVGSVLAAACQTRGNAELCRAVPVAVVRPLTTLSLDVARGPCELIVRPRDELGRPFETSQVVLAPAGVELHDVTQVEASWLEISALRAGAIVAFSTLHGDEAARFADLPAGTYTVCAVAIQGDTENPSLAQRLRSMTNEVPLTCTSITAAAGTVENSLVIPAANRVWLGEPSR